MKLRKKNDEEKKGEIDKMNKKIKEFVKVGYEKMISYETVEGGFEWFGRAPGHEALTAYGLA